tara:strand:- start:113 stop:799 length:687 start_codon:yes stop_codon:yes gene_type:complete
MLLIGHRGAPSLKHENTIDSFKLALDSNIDGIELDVQLSKDQKLVVFHDLHTKTINNQYDLIKHLNFKELNQLAINFNIPTLEDILEIFPAHKELHIEIKSEDINNSIIINQVLALIQKHQLTQNTIISSFNPFVLSELNNHKVSIRLGLLWTQCPDEPWFITHYSYYKIKPYSFHASIEYINPEIVTWAIAHNLKLYYYTINSAQALNKAQKLNADGIFSDYPNILD